MRPEGPVVLQCLNPLYAELAAVVNGRGPGDGKEQTVERVEKGRVDDPTGYAVYVMVVCKGEEACLPIEAVFTELAVQTVGDFVIIGVVEAGEESFVTFVVGD